MGVAEFAVTLVSGGIGFVLADGLDRFLATYNPSAEGEKPKDKFTSDGAGTLANTLNIASPPGIARIAAGVGMTALPAIGAMYTSGYVRRSLEGIAIGSGASFFKTLWNNVIMPYLKPKDVSAASLQKSYIARLYPAEVAACINRKQEQTAVSSSGGAGALSGAPGVGDVGPFALQGPESYPSASEALAAGVRGTPGGNYPTVQNTWGTGEESYPTAAQALARQTGTTGAAWEPGPPPLPGPGPQAAPGEDPACGCIGKGNQFLGFVGDAQEETLYGTAAE